MAPVGVPLYYRVVAVKCDDTDAGASDTTTAILIPGTVLPPEFSYASGTYDSIISVALSCATPGARIYFTLDGEEPTTASNLYDDTPIEIDATTTIKAVAVKTSWNNSTVTETNYVSTVGITEMSAENLSLYPNPATEVLYLEWESDFTGNIGLNVFDISGRIVLQKTIEKSDYQLSGQINLAGLSPGQYYLRLLAGQTELIKSLMIIEK